MVDPLIQMCHDIDLECEAFSYSIYVKEGPEAVSCTAVRNRTTHLITNSAKMHFMGDFHQAVDLTRHPIDS